MYKVIRKFEDRDGHVYKVNDAYPKEGAEATKARLKELSTTKNKYKKPFIEEVEKDDKE